MTPIGYAEFRRRVLAQYRHRAPTTLQKVRQVLDILEVLGVCTTADLTTETALAFVAARGEGANPRTTAGLVGYLRTVCAIAVEEGWLDRPPNWKRARPRPGPPPPRKSLTGEQAGRLFAHLAGRGGDWAGHRLYAMAHLVGHCGLRYQELARLQPGDLDPRAGCLAVRYHGRRLKTAGSAASVPLPEAGWGVLLGWLPRAAPSPWVFPGAKGVGPWSGGAVGYRPVDRLRQACAAAGVPSVTWHGLRHTFAWVAHREWGLPLWAVQRILRHGSARTTELYLAGDDGPALAGLVRDARYPGASADAA